MTVISWLRNLLSSRYRIMSIYRSGMKHAKHHEPRQAIDDYSTVIGTKGVPADILSMALYNRAVVYDAISNTPAALADLQRVLSMSGTSEQVRTEARRKIARMERSQQRAESSNSKK